MADDLRQRIAEAQQQRAEARAALGPAGERIAAIAFDLATASRTVAPDEVYAAIAAHRDEVLATVQPELDRRDQHIAELQDKLCSFDDNGKCCCSFDGPGDVCAVHSPTVKQLRAEVRAQGDALIRARIQLIGRGVENAQLRTERSDFALQVGHFERRWESTVVEARRQAARAIVAEAELDRTRAELAEAREQMSGVWPCTCGHLPGAHKYDSVIGRNYCIHCKPDTDLHDYTAAPTAT